MFIESLKNNRSFRNELDYIASRLNLSFASIARSLNINVGMLYNYRSNNAYPSAPTRQLLRSLGSGKIVIDRNAVMDNPVGTKRMRKKDPFSSPPQGNISDYPITRWKD